MNFRFPGACSSARLKLLVTALFSLGFSVASFAQTPYPIEHGLAIPDVRTPWAVDSFENRYQLVPIHHSTVIVNKHTGANIAGSLAASFLYRPKVTTELTGASARTQLHTKTPVFYLLLEADRDPAGNGQDEDLYTFAIVRIAPGKDRRVVDNLSYTQLTGRGRHNDAFIATTTTKTADGWIRIEPSKAMDEGEYCLLPVPKTSGTYSTVVYDFGIHADAANASDAIAATEK
jgi:hypothetical protein